MHSKQIELRNKLYTQISFFIIIVSTSVLMCFAFYRALSFYKNHYSNLEKKLNDKRERIALSVSIPLYNYSIETIDKILLSQISDRDIIAIGIFEQGKLEYGFYKKDNKILPLADKLPSGKNTISTKKLIIQNDDVIGELCIVITKNFVNDEIKRKIQSDIFQIIVLDIVLLLISLSIIRSKVIKPLISLSNATQYVVHGELDKEINIQSKNEIGLLAEIFSSMRKSIKQKISDLEEEINKREQVEKDLRSTKTYLNNVVNSMPSALIGINDEGMINNMNIEAELLSKVEYHQAMNQKLDVIFTDLSNFLQDILQSISLRTVFEKSKITINKNGKKTLNNLIVYPLITDEMSGAVIRIDDITEKEKMEEILIQTEKMLSVGGLAAGMAHEINNPLGAIIQNTQNIQRRLSPDFKKNIILAEKCGLDLKIMERYIKEREICLFLEEIRTAGSRAAYIVSNMLSFSRNKFAQKNIVNISELIENTIELASNDFDLKKKHDFKHINIIKDYSSEILRINCVSTEIEQVFLNILKNGAQALSQKAISNKVIHIIVKRVGDYIRIIISDNGPGIKKEHLKRIFEPFFTTKPVGLGTGLGLSVSYFIITEHHKGKLSVDSVYGESTTFTIDLPGYKNENY